jgi:hypothetical protein
MKYVISEIARRASDAGVTPTTYLLNNFSEEELKDLRNVISQELDTHQLQTDVEGTAENKTDENMEPSELSDSEAENLMLDIYIELGIWMAEDAEDTCSYEEMVAA